MTITLTGLRSIKTANGLPSNILVAPASRDPFTRRHPVVTRAEAEVIP